VGCARIWFDGIILHHVTSKMARFTCSAHDYVIFWHQMQTNTKDKSQGHSITPDIKSEAKHQYGTLNRQLPLLIYINLEI
jgi:hypothetical protein